MLRKIDRKYSVMSGARISACAFMLMLTVATPALFSAIGCKSYPHSIDHDDHADYQYVACSCPCTRILDQRGQCLDCQHFGDPDRHRKGWNVDLR